MKKEFSKREVKLVKAIWSNDYYTIKSLLSKSLFNKPIDSNLKYSHGRSLLHLALLNNSGKEIIELLISKGADINSIDDDKYTPIILAIIKNRLDCTELMISNNANCRVVSFLTKCETFLKDSNSSSYIYKNGSSDRYLIQNGTLLHLSLLFGHKEMAEKLLSYGADINAMAIHGFAGPEGNNYSNFFTFNTISALHYAFRYMDGSFIKLLIQYGADVNSRDNKGRTPMHYVQFSRGYPKVIDLLIQHGADVNAKDKNGIVPLHYVRFLEEKDIELLIANGADVNARDNNNMTPLHYLSETIYSTEEFKSKFELLLSKGADKNIIDKKGSTPVSYLTKENEKLFIELHCDNHEIKWCKCKNCGTVMNENHDWDGCKCQECGAVRNENHDMEECVCLKCRTVIHDWYSHKCKKCGEIDPEMYKGYYE